MIHVLYQFPKSTDAGSLDEFLGGNLIPGLRGAQGLRLIESSSGDLMRAGGPPPFFRVVEVSFYSLGDLMAYVQSPTGLATREFLERVEALILYDEVEEL